ncbi:MAG: hypothetical protein ACRC7H_00615, partial [Plesiomonas shigelloides]
CPHICVANLSVGFMEGRTLVNKVYSSYGTLYTYKVLVFALKANYDFKVIKKKMQILFLN